MKTKKPHQKFEHIPVHPGTKTQLDEVGKSIKKAKSISYDSIIQYLLKKDHGGEIE